uniref:Uncharacterized protein n=1 Tax=Bionectria ochroleuca TaxID=29856 RepID=A0A8H7K4J5_BIOOC
MLLVLKPEVVAARNLEVEDQERILMECVEETLANNGVMITRLKTRGYANAMKDRKSEWAVQPALKVCLTTALSKKDIEKAGVTIRHAITKVMTRKTSTKAASS